MKKHILLIFLCILSVQIALSETIEVTVDENELLNVSQQIMIYDPDGDPFTFEYHPPLDDEGLWQTDYSDAGTYYTNITASDGTLELVQEIKIIVKNINRDPIIESISPEDKDLTINELEIINFKVIAKDPEQDKLYYSWKLDKEEVSTDPEFRYKTDYYSEGTHTLKLTVSDGDLKKTEAWNIEVLNTNAPPKFEEMGDIEVKETETVTVVPKAIDIDGDKIYYNISEPVGNDGIWTPDYDDEGTYTIEITASDTKLETTKKIDIIVKNKDRIPVISTFSPEEERIEIDENEKVDFEIRAMDPDKDDLKYSWRVDNKKIGDERKFTYNSNYEDAGTHTIEVLVSDGTVSVSKEWFVAVKDINRAPKLERFEEITIDENQNITINATGSDPDGDDVIVTFSNPAERDGFWKTGFDDAGTHYITVTISDGDLSSFELAKVVVNNVDRPLEFDEIHPIIIYEGETVKFSPSAYDPDGEEITITAENLPNGSVFEDNIFTWTPGYDTAKRNTNWFGRLMRKLLLYNLFFKEREKFKITFKAESGNTTIYEDLSIIVKNKNRAPELEGVEDIIAKETEVVKPNITYFDPDGDHIKIRFNDPLNSNGEWLTDYEDHGLYNSSISVSDGDLITTKNLRISVIDKNRIPIISIEDSIKVKEGETISLEPKVIDLDGDNITLSYSGWMDSNEYTPHENDSGVYTVTVEASDGKDTTTKDITLYIEDVKEKSALWFYIKYILLGIIILAIIIVLLNLREIKRLPEDEKKKEKEAKEKPLKEAKKELKLAKKEVKVQKELKDIPFTPAQEEIIEKAEEDEFIFSEWIRKPEVKKILGIALILLLVAALILVNMILLKPSGEVKFEKIDPQEIAENQTIEIPFYAKNADNYSVEDLPKGSTIEGKKIIWTPDFNQSGSYVTKVCAFNNISSECINISIDVQNTNRIPKIHNIHPKKRIMFYVDSPLTFYVNATDADKEELDYVWKMNGFLGREIYAENILKITYSSPGKKELKVIVSDKESSTVQEWIIDVVERPPMTRKIERTKEYTFWSIDFPEEEGTVSFTITDEDSGEVIQVEGVDIEPSFRTYDIGTEITGDAIEIDRQEEKEDTKKVVTLGEDTGIEVISKKDDQDLEFVLE